MLHDRDNVNMPMNDLWCNFCRCYDTGEMGVIKMNNYGGNDLKGAWIFL